MQESYEERLNMLQNGDIEEIVIDKNEFIAFREVLVLRKDFKHFAGSAKQGGQVIYTYLDVARS